ncbi:MAG TPA: hypothetical protein VMH05_14145 [Bryobacteraceae bacterium]|nr:hypothetical protein [Bryobacteraceae bacterium]
MPFDNESPWHELFYELKSSESAGKPQFLASLRFDWDGPYPKCQELSDFLHALHWNACVDARNPHFDTITLPELIATEWSKRAGELDTPTKRFLDFAADRATDFFPQ